MNLVIIFVNKSLVVAHTDESGKYLTVHNLSLTGKKLTLAYLPLVWGLLCFTHSNAQ
jgi:hypothetical protein